MTRKSAQGLSLLEVMLAIAIMTLTLWSVQLLYINLLRGSRSSEARRAAVAEAENLIAHWRERVLELWPEGPLSPGTTEDEAFTVEDEVGEYLYRVEVSGRLPNPFRDDDTAALQDDMLEMQTLSVTVYYREKKDVSERERFVRIHGSVSK